MQAFFTTVKVPFRWTAITSSHSCSVMLKTIRSLRIPAQVTTTSSLPKFSMAVCTICSPPSMVDTDSKHATAVPPAWRISETTPSAREWSAPLPSTLTPGVHHHYLGPFLGHQHGDAPSDAPSGAGYDCYFVLQKIGHTSAS